MTTETGRSLPAAEAVLALAADHHDWHIWVLTGTVYATRRRRLTDDEVEAGLAATLHAPTPEELLELLADQAQRGGTSRRGGA